MKKVLFFLLFLVCIININAQEKKYFRLNTNPENPNRQPDWSKELVMVLTEDSPTIEIGSASGKKSKGNLPTGSAVIVDSKSLKALSVTVCGNTIFTNWTPKGKIISPREYKAACEDMVLVLLKLAKLQEGMDELLSRPKNNSNYSLAELKIMFERTLKEQFPKQEETPSTWTATKTITTFSSGIIGGLIGGYGFPKRNEITTQIVTPGVKVQTGDGTYVFGPQKIKTDTHVEKRFNWTGAAIGAGSGLIFGYLLNEVIF